MGALDELNRRLDAGETAILHGGMGSELLARGVTMDAEAWSALANLRHQEKVQKIHENNIRVGADVIITNTLSAGRMALSAACYEDRVAEANRRAAEAAVRARECAGGSPDRDRWVDLESASSRSPRPRARGSPKSRSTRVSASKRACWQTPESRCWRWR
jgi:methionine synthase I (cobalamin-dependent)